MFKKTCVIFYPKNVDIGSNVDQNKKMPSFWPIGQKTSILHDKIVIKTIFYVIWVVFLPMDQKDGNFVFWSTIEPIVTFVGLKSHTSP